MSVAEHFNKLFSTEWLDLESVQPELGKLIPLYAENDENLPEMEAEYEKFLENLDAKFGENLMTDSENSENLKNSKNKVLDLSNFNLKFIQGQVSQNSKQIFIFLRHLA